MSRMTMHGAADPRHRVVLVVEDDPELRELYAAYLEDEGFTAARAADGLEALLQIKRVRPANVVLDLLMPRLGGLDALRRIKAFDPSIRVVVVTGAEDSALPGQALALGASAILKKPVAAETLLLALTETSPAGSPVSDVATTVPTTPPTRQAGRVLVVDDEAEVRALLEDFLAPKGYRVRSVADGAAALREVLKEAPDLVLLDIDIPQLDGLEALRAIRGVTREVRIVMISGKASLDMAKRALVYGAFDYIAKPFDLDHLSEVVAAAVLWEGSTER
jgi:DNA-binding NtrC family response regulator